MTIEWEKEGRAVARVAIETLGCKVNQYDSAVMAAALAAAGHELVDPSDSANPADIYIINTCAVTGRAAAKSRQAARRAARRPAPGGGPPLVIVAGCYPQLDPEAAAALPGVGAVAGTADRAAITGIIAALEQGADRVRAIGDLTATTAFTEGPAPRPLQRTRAMVKVQEGCSHRCSYCVVPTVRGPSRSRPSGEVLDEVRRLAAAGYREVVLSGIHIGSYGRDLPPVEAGPRTLAGLLRLLDAEGGVPRLRLSSVELWDLTPELEAAVTGLERLCRHLHLPLQSGSDRVLKRMYRPYTANRFRRAVSRLRERCPEIGLTTDVIVGFPGETEADFRATLDVCDAAGFSRIHVFPFSPRPGTDAAAMPDHVPGPERARRARALRRRAAKLARAFHRRLVGRVVTILAEGVAGGDSGLVDGLTGNYVRVVFPGDAALTGRFCRVRVRRAGSRYVSGALEAEPGGPVGQG